MEVDGYYSLDTTGKHEISHILIEGSLVYQLSISNVSIRSTNNEVQNKSVLLETSNNCNVNYLQFNRINIDGIASLVSNSSGNLNVINASNIIHVNANNSFTFYLNNAKNEIKSLTVSNFYGSDLIYGGISKILYKKGDAF